jgi:hypothetical protein
MIARDRNIAESRIAAKRAGTTLRDQGSRDVSNGRAVYMAL